MLLAADINGHIASRDEIRAWELKRARRVARTLGVDGAATDLEQLSARLVERKLELGHDGIERRLARQLRAAAFAIGAGARLARGRRRMCTIELTGATGAAEHLPAWYAAAIAANDEVPLIAACPDHYRSRTNPDSSQEIIETTGGSPFPLRMFFDETDTSSIVTPPDPAFAVQWVAVALTEEGTTIGGIRHQFVDHAGGGFRVRLTVEFPATTPPWMIAAHRWHLACEFSNWIEAAAQSS